MRNSDDHYGSYKKLDYYTNFNEQEPPTETRVEGGNKIYDRKDGWVKVYNGHIGTFVWEREE